MDFREDFPRISLSNIHDWHRIKANYKSSVLTSLEEHIQSQGLVKERDALLAHTNQYLERVFTTAQPNLRINGHNYETAENEHNTEPFDEALDRRIWSLADTRLQWQKRIAEKRRTLPLEVERTVLDLFNQQRGVEAEVATAMDGEMTDDIDSEDDTDIAPRIEQGFQKTVALGEELDQTTVDQEERADRALVATGEVKGLKG